MNSCANDLVNEKRIKIVIHSLTVVGVVGTLEASKAVHLTHMGWILLFFKIEKRLPQSDKLQQMIRQGIPHSIRPQIWMRLTGALTKKITSDTSYKIIVRTSSNDHLMTSKQIEKVSHYHRLL